MIKSKYLLIFLLLTTISTELAASKPVATLNHGAGVRAIAFSSTDPTILATAGDNHLIKLWNLNHNTATTLAGHTDTINDLAFSTDGKRLASASDDKSLMLWDVQNQHRITTIQHFGQNTWQGDVEAVDFSPDGKLFATAGNSYLKLYNANTYTEITTLSNDKWLITIDFSHDSKFLATGEHLDIRDGTSNFDIWDIQQKRLIQTPYKDRWGIDTVQFSDSTIATIAFSEREVKRWDISDWKPINAIPTGGLNDFIFSADGETLIALHSNAITLWSVQSGNRIVSLRPRDNSNYQTLDISPDGKTVAVGDTNGVIHLWNIHPYLQSYQPALVKTIYFIPKDRAPQPNIDANLNTLLKNTQRFFADQTEKHGLGRKTFNYETDPNGNIVIHHVAGKFNDTHYHHDTYQRAWDELKDNPKFSLPHHLHLIVIDIATEHVFLQNYKACGVGGVRADGWHGKLIIPASGKCFNLRTLRHELGHAFGLDHDFRDNTYIMSYGDNPNQLSQCAAEWIQASRFFNPPTVHINQPALITQLQPLAYSDNTILPRFRIADPNGIHQIHFSAPTTANDPTGGSKIYSCHTSDNKNETEITTAEVIMKNKTQVALSIMDNYGNFSTHHLTVYPDEAIRIQRPLDVNQDGQITLLDLIHVAAMFGSGNENPADLNGDGTVNIPDLILIASAIENTPKAPAAEITTANLQHWIAQAHALKINDPTLRRGVTNLEKLLESITPKQTALLPNFPNPFNPETWIPYQLATAANVTLTIYDTTGTVIRQWNLGHQQPGHYTDKNRAAYWDGRNQTGESVASGTYFYQLQVSPSQSVGAGNFSDTRKLVILK